MRSPIFELIRMKAADTNASRAIADWTPLAVVSRSLTTAEIDTFMNDVSTTSTNIAAASRNGSRELAPLSAGTAASGSALMPVPDPHRDLVGDRIVLRSYSKPIQTEIHPVTH